GERSDLPESADRPEPTRRGRVLVGVAVAGAVGLVAWTGGNDPQLSWFGPVVSHGPRDRPEVAITFDDGPNESATLEVTRILDDHGVKGTFFLVGRAVAARPAVARQVVADGHLVGNHSYHHDYWRWLDPRYPELGATQAVIGRDVGVCPRFFRPPHGQRTPLMNLQLARRGMVAVTWDVSAADWVTNDPDLVARRILARVRPGSIILLHDSIDGHVDADRRVVIEALPRILDGLERKGLQPVRLDRLIGGPAYLPDSDC
ncbi:MAG TPA: polysaccharide deacetylase family protein, partial [Microthrixaceae bacterium]|nr:polysaccharide deacetylase family protein [Microthrixaceae bacterium]